MRYYLIFFLMQFSFFLLHAQVNSLYSSFGLGITDVRDYNTNTAMGSVGIALRSDKTITDLNPSSFAGIDKDRLMLELSAKGTMVNYVSSTESLQGSNFTVTRAALGINLFKNLGTVFGLKKYSMVSYNSMVEKSIDGTQTSMTDYIQGTGGLNQFYIGNGFQIGKNLSIGVTGGFMFGPVKKTDKVIALGRYTTVFENSTYYNKLYWNTGIQYKINAGNTNITLGGMVQPEIKLNMVKDFYIKDDADNILLADDDINAGNFQFPLQWGAGLALENGKSTITMDIIGQQWAQTGYKGASFSAQDLRNIALGYRFTQKRKTWYGIADGVSYMIGLQHDNGYLKIYNKQVPAYLLSMGFSVPSLQTGIMYSMALRVGQRGMVSAPLVKESFVDLTLNVGLFTMLRKGGIIYD